jgi:hypothetical protein
MVFPPHSTHTLQPLDVVMFKPLSSSYSNELTHHLHNAQGLVSIKKGDFFPLFWRAWSSSFQENTILKAFEATGIWPTNPSVILNRFQTTANKDRNQPSRLSPSNWNQLQRLLRSAAKDGAKDGVKKLSAPLHHLQVQNELLRHENEGLRAALSHKQKHKGKSKALDLQQRKEYHSSAVFWSPRKFREARAREAVRERDEIEEKLQKARAKKQREELQLQRQVNAEEKRVERRRLKEMRDAERAKKVAERARKVEAQHHKKTQQAQQRKRKALRASSSSKNKRQKRSVEDGAPPSSIPPPSSISPRITSRGRSVNLPSKFR